MSYCAEQPSRVLFMIVWFSICLSYLNHVSCFNHLKKKMVSGLRSANSSNPLCSKHMKLYKGNFRNAKTSVG